MKNIIKTIVSFFEVQETKEFNTSLDNHRRIVKELHARIDAQKKSYERMNKALEDLRKEDFAGMTSYPVMVESFVEGEF